MPGGRLPRRLRDVPLRRHADGDHAGAVVRHPARDPPDEAAAPAAGGRRDGRRVAVRGRHGDAAAGRGEQLRQDEHLSADGNGGRGGPRVRPHAAAAQRRRVRARVRVLHRHVPAGAGGWRGRGGRGRRHRRQAHGAAHLHRLRLPLPDGVLRADGGGWPSARHGHRLQDSRRALLPAQLMREPVPLRALHAAVQTRPVRRAEPVRSVREARHAAPHRCQLCPAPGTRPPVPAPPPPALLLLPAAEPRVAA